MGHVHGGIVCGIAVARAAVSTGTDGVNCVELIFVGTRELVTGGCNLVSVRDGNELAADASGDAGCQRTYVAGMTVAVTVALPMAVTVAGGGLMGGNRHHHCQRNLQEANQDITGGRVNKFLSTDILPRPLFVSNETQQKK